MGFSRFPASIAPLGGPGPDYRVDFVDEQNDLPFAIGDFLQHRLQALFELTTIFGTGNQRPHIQGDQLAVLKGFGHVAFDDALGQTFSDRGLTHPRFANQHGVILRPSGQNLHRAGEFRRPGQ